MRKGLKIGMLAVAFLATMTAVISTGKVEAQEATTGSGSNIVRVSIDAYNNGQNDCSGQDYIFNFSGSTTQQVGIQTGRISCILGNGTGKAITLLLSGDLVEQADDNIIIPKENIKLKNGTWTKTPDDLGTGTVRSNFDNFHAERKTLFNKNAKKVGDASSDDVVIQVTVPEGQPGGTYNGTLVLQF